MFLIITAVSFFIYSKRVESRERGREREKEKKGRERCREGGRERGREGGREEERKGRERFPYEYKQAKITESTAPVTHDHFFTKILCAENII